MKDIYQPWYQPVPLLWLIALLFVVIWGYILCRNIRGMQWKVGKHGKRRKGHLLWGGNIGILIWSLLSLIVLPLVVYGSVQHLSAWSAKTSAWFSGEYCVTDGVASFVEPAGGNAVAPIVRFEVNGIPFETEGTSLTGLCFIPPWNTEELRNSKLRVAYVPHEDGNIIVSIQCYPADP